MSESADIDRMTWSRRGVVGLPLVLVLAGCTTGDPTETPQAGDGERIPTVPPTMTGLNGDTADEVEGVAEPGPGLYQVDLTTGETESILSGDGELLHEPERSPNGSSLVYQGTTPTGIPQIFVLEDGMEHQLTDLPGGAMEPTWSPDGSQIAFAGAVGEDRDSDIMVMDADGGDVHLLAGTDRSDRRPDWSPDGA